MKFSLPLIALAAVALSSKDVASAPAEQDVSGHVFPRENPQFVRKGTIIEPLHKTDIRNRLRDLERRKANANAVFLQTNAGPAYPAGVEPSAGCTTCNSSLSFAGSAAKAFNVGTQIPTLGFKTKNSWAGNIAVSSPQTSKDAALYFWLWGADRPQGQQSDDLIIWLNGGPGCSSLGGMVQENGPFLYQNKKEKPYPNPYSWTRAANILYVEQPVQVGFTKGSSKNMNEEQLAQQFASFIDNFYVAFPELASKKLYITGESYAGTYIPYFMNYLYTRPGGLKQLQGGIIIDGVITDTTNQEDLVAYQYAVQHQAELKFTDADVAKVKAESDKCNLSTYVDANLNYPAKGRLPDYSRACSPWETLYSLATQRSSTFNVYNIDTADTSNTSPLGAPNSGSLQYLRPTFFDNYQLQSYINAPHKKWVECNTKVFVNGDQSGYPDQTPSYEKSILANVIESSKNFIIMNGNLDALIITNGTSLALQNLTWANAQGFTKPPSTPLYDVDGNQGGTYTEERGLAYAIIPKSGHMIPGDTPSTGLAALQKLIGLSDWTKK